MAQSQGFYEAEFDWQFNDYGPGYAGIQKRGGGEAGGRRFHFEDPNQRGCQPGREP
jgi:hypothetical protein